MMEDSQYTKLTDNSSTDTTIIHWFIPKYYCLPYKPDGICHRWVIYCGWWPIMFEKLFVICSSTNLFIVAVPKLLAIERFLNVMEYQIMVYCALNNEVLITTTETTVLTYTPWLTLVSYRLYEIFVWYYWWNANIHKKTWTIRSKTMFVYSGCRLTENVVMKGTNVIYTSYW